MDLINTEKTKNRCGWEVRQANQSVGNILLVKTRTTEGETLWALGITTERGWRNKGIATWGLRRVVEEMAVSAPIQGSTRNPACARVMEKCGMLEIAPEFQGEVGYTELRVFRTQ